jgi:hypothetical protein
MQDEGQPGAGLIYGVFGGLILWAVIFGLVWLAKSALT